MIPCWDLPLSRKDVPKPFIGAETGLNIWHLRTVFIMPTSFKVLAPTKPTRRRTPQAPQLSDPRFSGPGIPILMTVISRDASGQVTCAGNLRGR
jgi:hypothetical protein